MAKGMAEIFAEVARQQADMQAAMARARAVSGSSTVQKGMLTVTVDARGAATEVKFANRNYRTMEPQELGRVVLEAVQKAQANAAEQVEEAVKGSAPPGMPSLEEFASGEFDLAKLMPAEVPVTPEEILRNLRGESRRG